MALSLCGFQAVKQPIGMATCSSQQPSPLMSPLHQTLMAKWKLNPHFADESLRLPKPFQQPVSRSGLVTTPSFPANLVCLC